MLILNPPALGDRIRLLRRAKGYSQQQLADKAKCNRKTIIDLEAGKNEAVYTVQGHFRAGALSAGKHRVDAELFSGMQAEWDAGRLMALNDSLKPRLRRKPV